MTKNCWIPNGNSAQVEQPWTRVQWKMCTKYKASRNCFMETLLCVSCLFLWDFIKYHFWFMDQVTMTWKHLWGPKEPFLTYKILVMFSRVLRLNILYFKSLCYYDPISKNQSSVSYICLWKHNSAESEGEDLEDCHYTCSEGDLHEVKLMEAVEGAGRLLTVVAWQFDSFKVI